MRVLDAEEVRGVSGGWGCNDFRGFINYIPPVGRGSWDERENTRRINCGISGARLKEPSLAGYVGLGNVVWKL